MIAQPLDDLNGPPAELNDSNGAMKRAHDGAALLAEATMYRLLIEQIPAITYIAALDADSSTLFTSPQIEAILGFSQAEWMADPTRWLQQIHPDDKLFVLHELARMHAGGDPGACEYRMLDRAGQVHWFVDDAVVVRDAAGYPQALCGVLINITKQKRLEAELAELRRQLEQSRTPHLTERELAVLRLVSQWRTDGQIAQELAICERTVRNCLRGICAKLGVKKRAEALREARRLGMLDE